MRRAGGSDTLRRARRVLAIEAAAVKALAGRLDDGFERAVAILAQCTGKVVVTGMGKSGLICRKIAATLASTGTPAVFLHAAEGAHGDVGMFVKGDVVVALSLYSGETEEIVRLLPLVKRLDLPLVALTGGAQSTLARAADVVLDVSVTEEACPLGLAPTASTTAALALGDALAVVLLERKRFRAEDFAVLHPGGALGRRFLKVGDVMHGGETMPLVQLTTPFRDTLVEITSKRLGVTGVVDARAAWPASSPTATCAARWSVRRRSAYQHRGRHHDPPPQGDHCRRPCRTRARPHGAAQHHVPVHSGGARRASRRGRPPARPAEGGRRMTALARHRRLDLTVHVPYRKHHPRHTTTGLRA